MNRFRLSAFPVDDYDTSIVRIEKSTMQEMGIHEGDTVKIKGVESTGAICYSVDDGFKIPNDSDITYLNEKPHILPTIRASNHVLQNINRHGAGLITVAVEKVHDRIIPAHKICLMSLNSSSDNEGFDTDKLVNLIASHNDRFYFPMPDRKYMYRYVVTEMEPADYCQITKDTKIEFVPTNPETIQSTFTGVKLEKIQDVIPIVYQELKNNVDVMMPSIEIFETGFRFYVYVKSRFDTGQQIPNGHTSIVVTLEDDIGNSYDLSSHGGGGSHSADGFEYKHEFHGKPFDSDAKHLTITLHEVLIQERFPRESSSFRQKHFIGTKDEYAEIDKFPSFCIIQGPWNTTFALKDIHK
ncbi:MAG: DUF5643 domain-containing protein [Nitrosopumilus sp.]|nr:DUF5643 domain-containing protein [Nitrosopumilus sp.]